MSNTISTAASTTVNGSNSNSNALLPNFGTEETRQDFQRMLRNNVAQMSNLTVTTPLETARPVPRAPEQAAPANKASAAAPEDGISETQREEHRLNARAAAMPGARPESSPPAPARPQGKADAAAPDEAGHAAPTPRPTAETAAAAVQTPGDKPKASAKADKSSRTGKPAPADAGKAATEAAAATPEAGPAADALTLAADAIAGPAPATDPALLTQQVAALDAEAAKAGKTAKADPQAAGAAESPPSGVVPQAGAAQPASPQAAATSAASAAAKGREKSAPAGLALAALADGSAQRTTGASTSPARLNAADPTPATTAALPTGAAAAAAAGIGKAATPSETLVSSTAAAGNRPGLQALGAAGAMGGPLAAGASAGQAVQFGATAPDSASASAPAAPSELVLPQPLTDPAFSTEMAARLSVLASKGVQEAHLHLNPADMGPVAVQITVDGQQAQVSFHAAHAETRAVLENSLPELAAALRDNGLTLSGGGVFQQAPGQGGSNPSAQDGPASGRSSNSANGRTQRISGEDLPAAGLAATPLRPARGVVDVYA